MGAQLVRFGFARKSVKVQQNTLSSSKKVFGLCRLKDETKTLILSVGMTMPKLGFFSG